MSAAFRLPCCGACGAFHYPAREVCPACFTVPEGAMAWREASPAGIVAATTRLHVSLDPAFAGRLPVALATVTLDAGPTVIAFAAGGLRRGDRVRLAARLDERGRAVLEAAPAG